MNKLTLFVSALFQIVVASSYHKGLKQGGTFCVLNEA